MIITINGKEGSGKTTVAEMLAEKLGYERFYIGGMRREAAKKRGMTLEEFNKWSETHPEGDKEFDDFLTNLGKTRDNFIIESRTAFHFIPQSIKIYLDVDPDIAAKRIFTDKKKSERNERKDMDSIPDIKEGLQRRMESDNLRYKKYYNLNIHDSAHYDIIVDTNNKPAGVVLEEVMKHLKQRGLTRD